MLLGPKAQHWTSKVIQSKQKKERKKKYDRTGRKHPTKLVKAAACCLLSPLTMTTGWMLRGEDTDEAKHRLSSLMSDLKIWMARRKLKLNDGKTGSLLSGETLEVFL